MQGHEHPYDASHYDEGFPAPARVSILAISSLVTGILSVVGCCVPAFGILPVGLGIGAIVGIGRARGAVAGRGMAIGGLVLGLLSLVVSTGLWVGAATFGGKIGPVYSQAFSDDPAVVRSVLSSSAASEVTEEKIAEFQRSLTEDFGGPVTIPRGFLALYKGYARVDPDELHRRPDARPGNPYLLPAEGPGGWLVVVVVMSEREASPSWLPYLEDVGYVAPDGRIVWLLGPPAPPGENQSPPPGPSDDGAGSPASDPGA